MQLRADKERFYAADYPPEFRLDPGDLLIAMTDLTQSSPILGSPLVVPADRTYLHNQRLGKIVITDDQRLDRHFAYFLFASDVIRSQLRGSATGSTVRHTAPGRICASRIKLPPLSTQCKIAAILSAYDDLIENNNRRIKILEEMAQRIYREWFVEFRYPGHQGVPLADSELGPIPEGWEVEPLVAVCDVMQAGGTPSRADAAYWDDGTVDWFKTTELQDGFLQHSVERVSSAALTARKTRLFPDETILMAIYGAPTVGRMGVLTADGCCNQAALALRADEARLPQSILYYALAELRGHFNSIAQGAAQQNISKEKVAGTKVVCPPAEIARTWTKTVESNWQQRRTLTRTLSTLAATRNLLLPRLVSGEIDVDDLDIAVPDLAA